MPAKAKDNLPAVKPAGPAPLALNGLQDVLTLGEVLAKSGFFSDARTAAQAVVKVLAGRELGFPTIASMVGVYIVEGRPSIGANLLAAAIRRSGQYDYQILEHTDQACAIRFKRRMPDNTWVDLEPVERLTLKEAYDKNWHLTLNGKTKSTWVKTPKNMLFARCISNGFKFHCPDLCGGMVVYDPDELDKSPAFPNGEFSVTSSQIDDYAAREESDISPGDQGEQEGNAQAPATQPSLPATPQNSPMIGSPASSAGAPQKSWEITCSATMTPRITEAQVAEIGELIRQSGADVPKFLAYYRVKTVRQFDQSQYLAAKEALLRKLEAKK